MSSQSVHLLVLIHGMWGNPSHLAELYRVISEVHDSEDDEGASLHVLLAETNRDDSTYDGIDWGGERVAQEVLDEVKKLEEDGRKVIRFSATGYSLGGLVARYVVGILHQRQFFKDVKPINFNTLATPHLGLPRYPSVISSLFSSLGPRLLSRTGEQFYCVDKWSKSGRPLLEVMADPDRIFYRALLQFQHIRIYANSVNDVTVPYVTAAIEVDDPFLDHQSNGVELSMDDEYKALIRNYSLPLVPPPRPRKPIIFSPKWFRNRRPLLPPALQFRFPWNIIVYTLLPVLVPTFLTLAIVRLSLAARSSRARIKLLEADESNSDKLIHIIGQLERQVEDAVVDLMDDPLPISEDEEGQKSLSHSTSDDSGSTVVSELPSKKKSKDKPILTPLQHKIAESLNTLPIKKELAFFPGVRNSHAIIVCRDIKRFEIHRKGESVVRHWATSFIL
ncbi:hypothetical protein AX16_006573 [Volvariella volvacea WC 439]|nr:hypothetical protein AX16_006573 [Volvariella volvacea WC 439]